jgi:tRNA modification GTPase
MRQDKSLDTIAAAATPAVPSAIAILRISGAQAFSVLRAAFVPRGTMRPRMLCLGDALAPDGARIDEALAVKMPGPHSYTGEDCAEIYTHGSPGVVAAVLDTLFAAGARQAEPGEFTRRAFLNGRMDLTQSEAVIDLIDSRTRAAAENAAAQLSGVLGARIEGMRTSLIEMAAQFSAMMDFPDEEVPELELVQAEEALARIEQELCTLHDSYDRGAMLKNGIPVAICGRPNAGKSSLLNAIAGFDRSIVTSIPGTTRDVVEQTVTLSGLGFVFSDTAGLRESEDEVERIGIDRARQALSGAAAVIAVFDGSQPLTAEDEAVLAEIAGKQAFIVINKADLPQKIEIDRLNACADVLYPLSAKSGLGVAALCGALAGKFEKSEISGESYLTNPRQKDAVRRAIDAVRRAREASRNLTADVVCTDIETACETLGEITGQSASEEIINGIFSRFCVGK